MAVPIPQTRHELANLVRELRLRLEALARVNATLRWTTSWGEPAELPAENFVEQWSDIPILSALLDPDVPISDPGEELLARRAVQVMNMVEIAERGVTPPSRPVVRRSTPWLGLAVGAALIVGFVFFRSQ